MLDRSLLRRLGCNQLFMAGDLLDSGRNGSCWTYIFDTIRSFNQSTHNSRHHQESCRFQPIFKSCCIETPTSIAHCKCLSAIITVWLSNWIAEYIFWSTRLAPVLLACFTTTFDQSQVPPHNTSYFWSVLPVARFWFRRGSVARWKLIRPSHRSTY
jgi:hypothetical protein